MALVIHENTVKVLLINKFYIIECIEDMIYGFGPTEFIYYDGEHLRLLSTTDDKILSTPEPGIISINVFNQHNYILIYSNKLIYHNYNDIYTLNVIASKYARIEIKLNHGIDCIVVREPEYTHIIKPDKILERLDYPIFGVYFDKNLMVYHRFINNWENCTYNILTGEHKFTNIPGQLIKYKNYTIINNNLYYDKKYLCPARYPEYTEGILDILDIDHNDHSVLIRYNDKTYIRLIGLRCNFIIHSDVELYHKRGLYTKSARKI